jgi:galactokinase
MNSSLNEVSRLYTQTFGEPPRAAAQAPGRVEVLGNHTDYNQGLVLSCAIDRHSVVAVGISPTNRFELVSSQFNHPLCIDSCAKQSQQSWVNYPLGVYEQLLAKKLPLRPFRLAVHGDIPLGAGLSSSAALEVATALALCALFECTLDSHTLALVCQKAENEFVGMQCGLLDQFSSIFGKKDQLLCTDFRTLEHSTIALPHPAPLLVITDSGTAHSLVDSAYNDRRQECTRAAHFFATQRANNATTLRDVSSRQLAQAREQLDPVAFRRASHIVGEIERVQKGMELLKQGELKEFGALLYASHDSSQHNFENSTPQLDALVRVTESVPGVYGSRLTGGGFGGATLTLVAPDAVPLLTSAIQSHFIRPDTTPVQPTTVALADGAALLAL